MRTTRLQGNLKGACICERYGARSIHAAKPAESSKLELACLHLWLLAHLQRNLFGYSCSSPPSRVRDSDADVFLVCLLVLIHSLHAVN